MKSCSKTSYVSLCHLATIIDVVINLIPSIIFMKPLQAITRKRKGDFLIIGLSPTRTGTRKKVAQRKADYSLRSLASKKVTGYYSFIPLNRSGQPIL